MHSEHVCFCAYNLDAVPAVPCKIGHSIRAASQCSRVTMMAAPASCCTTHIALTVLSLLASCTHVSRMFGVLPGVRLAAASRGPFAMRVLQDPVYGSLV